MSAELWDSDGHPAHAESEAPNVLQDGTHVPWAPAAHRPDGLSSSARETKQHHQPVLKAVKSNPQQVWCQYIQAHSSMLFWQPNILLTMTGERSNITNTGQSIMFPTKLHQNQKLKAHWQRVSQEFQKICQGHTFCGPISRLWVMHRGSWLAVAAEITNENLSSESYFSYGANHIALSSPSNLQNWFTFRNLVHEKEMKISMWSTEFSPLQEKNS